MKVNESSFYYGRCHFRWSYGFTNRPSFFNVIIISSSQSPRVITLVTWRLRMENFFSLKNVIIAKESLDLRYRFLDAKYRSDDLHK